MGHRLSNGTSIWSKSYSFKSSPYPGQDSLQRIIIFGDMGKVGDVDWLDQDGRVTLPYKMKYYCLYLLKVNG